MFGRNWTNLSMAHEIGVISHGRDVLPTLDGPAPYSVVRTRSKGIQCIAFGTGLVAGVAVK